MKIDKSKLIYKKLGEVCEVINGLWTGKKPPFKHVGVIRNTNFSKACILNDDNIAYIDVEESAFKNKRLEKGDIIIEKSGGSDKQPVGRPVLFYLDGEFSFSNFTSVLRIVNKDIILPAFLHKQLVHFYFRGVTKSMQSHTTGIHNLDFKKYKSLSIMIPSIPIQQKIVLELDKLNNLISMKQQQLKEFDSLAQSVFYQMFGDPLMTIANNNIELGKACSLKAGKAIKAEELSEMPSCGLYPCFGGNGVRGYINRYSHNGTYPIIGRQGALCGNVNLARGQFYATEHALVVTPKQKMNPIWLYYTLKYMNLEKYAHGVAQPGISVKDLNPIPFHIVNITDGQSFAHKIEAIEHQKTLAKSCIADLQLLLDSKMDEYFG